MTTDTKTYRLAGFWVRFWAFLFDLLAISTLSRLLFVGLPTTANLSVGSISIFGLSAAFIGLVGFLYFATMTRIWGQTLGKMIVGIKVIRADNRPLDWGTLFFREGIGRFISQLLGLQLGYIWCAFHPRKQGWHDMIGNTYVVLAPELEVKRTVEFQE
ncbi:putative RDD family membrane protein YckC [Desulfitispora alkaliphila]|uniref:RDD family protein n=1 Tax=Desulfitispora alkaliphila TaxID=622674 RepID=UPI003D1D90E8